MRSFLRPKNSGTESALSLEAVELPRVTDQVLPRPEFVVALDPRDAGTWQDAPERGEDFLSNLNFLQKMLAAARREIEA